MTADLVTRVPPQGTQAYELLMAMQRGERITPLVAVLKYRVMALSQRVGDLKRKYGWPIDSITVETEGGARVSEYFLP